jgi:hypothetical protein
MSDERNAKLQTRDGCIKFILHSLSDRGFFYADRPRVYRDGDELIVDVPVNAGTHEKYEFVSMQFRADVSGIPHNDVDVNDICSKTSNPRDVGLKAHEVCRKMLDTVDDPCTCYISNGERLCVNCVTKKEANDALSAAGFPSKNATLDNTEKTLNVDHIVTKKDVYESLKSEIEHIKFLDKDDERIVSVCEGVRYSLNEIVASNKSFPIPVLSHHYEPKYEGEVMSLLWAVANNSTFEIEFISKDKVNWTFVLTDGSVTNAFDADRHEVVQKFISNMKVDE